MEIRDLFGAVRRFWLLAAAVFVVIMAIGVAAAYLPKQRYQSTATLIASPVSDTIDFSTVDTIRFLLPSLAAQATTTRFEDEVEARLPGIAWDGISISALDEPDSSILTITVEAYDPRAAAIVANASARNLVQRKASKLVTMEVLDPARPNTTPVSPNRRLILFASIVLGLIAATLAAVGANALFPRVRSTPEIRRRFGLEVIGEIPNTRNFPRQASRLFDPQAGHVELVEAYQRLRANFEIVAADRRVIGITSATASEGKSAVSANLAWAVASLGQEVVAVDTDLRRPTLHEYFGMRPATGVADIPLGAEIDRLLLPTGLSTLRFLPAGFAVQHPTSILHSAYPKILEELGDALLIVDMPPILGTADAVLVATMTTSVLLVTDARHGDPAELDQVLHELDRSGANVLGVVLNRATVKRSGRTDVYYTEFARRQAAPAKKGVRGRLFGKSSEVAEVAPPVATPPGAPRSNSRSSATAVEPADKPRQRAARGG